MPNLSTVGVYTKFLSLTGKTKRFLIFITLYFFIGNLIINPFEESHFGKALLFPIHEILSNIISYSCTLFLQPFYPDIHSSVDHVIFISNKPVIILKIPGCTGLGSMLRLSLTLLFYPLLWRLKLIAWPISMFTIFFATILHFLLLILIANHLIELFQFAHNWLTKAIFYWFYFLCWLIWEQLRVKCSSYNVC